MTTLEKTFKKLKTKYDSLLTLELRCYDALVDFLKEYPDENGLYLSHEGCGIEHYITDFNDCEMDIPKIKVMTTIRYDKNKKCLIASYDGGETNHFGIEDMAYLLEEITNDWYIEEVVEKGEIL